MLKTVLALALVVAGVATAAAAASPTTNRSGWTVISYPAGTHGYRFTTDTLGGNGHPTRTTPAQGYRFITDTLAPGGRSEVGLITVGGGFSWADAGVGAGAGVGALVLLTGTTLLVLRRRGRLAI
jgi:opacity protein-like surface antigen